jgi:hypothetical protein
MADDFERGGSKLYAALARAFADDPLVAAIVGDHQPRWEAPLRLFGGVHYLELSGVVQHPWLKFRGVLESHHDWLKRFVAEQPVQTNEVQRSWALLPAFLTVADGRPLDIVELGPSAGLNLFWDRYRYRYGEAVWGSRDAPLELSGEAAPAPPSHLFTTEVEVRKRVGIDRRPVDVTTDHGARLLEAFVWADQGARLERARRAIEIARTDPPELLQGDYVEILPSLLATRDLDALTIVFHSASAVYLGDDERAALQNAIERAARRGSLAWISYEIDRDEEVGYRNFVLDVQAWPDGVRRRLGRLDGHANTLEWLGPVEIPPISADTA